MDDKEHNQQKNEESMKVLANLAKNYQAWINDEIKKTKQELVVSTVGKQDPKRHLNQVIFEFRTLTI